MGTDSEEPQLNRRSRAATNPPTPRSHRTRPSFDSSHRSRQQVSAKPGPRQPTEPSVPDRPRVPHPQQQTVTSPRATDNFSRPRGLSISSPFQVASPTSSSLSPSGNEYFSPQPTSSSGEARSPAFRRPPASHSSHGLETSRGPPIALISRGSYSADIARHIEGKGQGRADFGLAQAQLLQLGLISPGGTPRKNKGGGRGSASNSRSSSLSRDRRDSSAEDQSRKQKMESDEPVSSSFEDSEQEIARSKTCERRRGDTENGNDPNRTSLGEDLFLNIAEDTPQAEEEEKLTRRRSRIARASQRQSLPTNTYSPSTIRPDSKGNDVARTHSQAHHRRASQVPPPAINTRLPVRGQSPMSASSIEHRVRGIPQPSPSPFSARPREPEGPGIAQYNRRRPSNTETNFTPSNKAQTYKRSNLQYTSSNHDSAQDEAVVETANSRTFSQAEGTESVDSGPAPSTVWDELDELKSRIREIESRETRNTQGAPSSVSNDRPRTATTTVTTISSSPKQRRKAQSPSEQVNDLYSTLGDALARCKEYLSPMVYRSLEVTANEALELAATTGSSGPQGAAFPLTHMLNGANSTDRQVRRRVHNICQGLTELCVNLCEGKVAPASPFRQLNSESRRGSMQFNGDPPTYVHARSGSVEPEGIVRSPSRALSRIEARRVPNGLGSYRQASEEPGTPSVARFGRTGSILASRHNVGRESSAGQYDDEEESTIRVPSRAMTEYAHLRPQPSTAPRNNRHSREYTSQEPLPQPHFQSSPLTGTPPVRRGFGTDTPNQQAYLANATSTLRDVGASKYYERRNGAPSSSTYEPDERAIYKTESGRRLTQPGSGRYETPVQNNESPPTGLNRAGSLGSRRMIASQRRFGTRDSSSVNSSLD